MKKKILALLFVIMVVSSEIILACGGVYYACGAADVVSHGTDFWQNCNAGDRIRVVDVCHPAEKAHTFWIDEV